MSSVIGSGFWVLGFEGLSSWVVGCLGVIEWANGTKVFGCGHDTEREG